jgi:hypothetical protein
MSAPEKVAKLVVRMPGGERQEFPLGRDPATIGRGRDCDLVVENVYVSRHHARIVRKGDRYVLIDEKSKNGTYVNGKRISAPHTLSPGDQIGIAGVLLEFVEVTAEDVTPTWPGPMVREQLKSPVQVDIGAWEVFVDGKKLECRLSVQEFALLSLLYRRAGEVCRRDELGDAIWGKDRYDYNMLHRLVHRLKEKIEPNPRQPRYIESIPGVGYRLRIHEP